MIINRENYESIMLDFMEGKLSDIEQDEVLDFLVLNPDLMQEIKDLNLVSLEPENISFHPKQNLIKKFPDSNSKPCGSNFEMFAIAYLENDLDPGQRLDFEEYLSQNPDHRKEFELWSKTKLEVDNISYPFKKELEKPVVQSYRAIWLLIPAAIAASLAILLLIFTNPAVPESLSEQKETVIIPDQNLRIAEVESSDPKTQKNPITISEKEKPLHPELLGKRDSTRDKVADPINRDQISKENISPVANPEKTVRSEDLLHGVQFSSNIIAEFQPEPDRIKPLNLTAPSGDYGNLFEVGIAKMDIDKVMEDFTKEDLNMWNIANYGIEGVNKLVGSEMKLMASKNEEGEISGFKFTSRILKISAPVQQKKSHAGN